MEYKLRINTATVEIADAKQSLAQSNFPKVVEHVKKAIACNVYLAVDSVVEICMEMVHQGHNELVVDTVGVLQRALYNPSHRVREICNSIFRDNDNALIKYLCAIIIENTNTNIRLDQELIEVIDIYNGLISSGMNFVKYNLAKIYNSARYRRRMLLPILHRTIGEYYSKSTNDIFTLLTDVLLEYDNDSPQCDKDTYTVIHDVVQMTKDLIKVIIKNEDGTESIDFFMGFIRENQCLKRENLELKYAPDGVGYRQAREEFYELMNTQMNSSQ